MGRGKMDEAAAARIRKARGEKDDFARRASIAARANKENGGQGQGGGQGGSTDGKQDGGNTSKK